MEWRGDAAAGPLMDQAGPARGQNHAFPLLRGGSIVKRDDQPTFHPVSTWKTAQIMFAFRVLGGASLEGENGPLQGKAVQPRRIALLALLAADAHLTLSREKLIAFLWPESDAAQGRHRLSESLYVLRQALGEGALSSEGDGVRLDLGQLSCDATSFLSAIRSGDLEGAVSHYAGAFLDGFFLKSAPEFDRWVESERQRLSEAYGRALETLATDADRGGACLEAVEWWSRLAAHDPYNSRFALGLMEALARAGDPGNAIHHAREHARFLKEVLGIEPTSELLAYVEGLRNGVTPRQAVVGETAGAEGGEPHSIPVGEPEPSGLTKEVAEAMRSRESGEGLPGRPIMMAPLAAGPESADPPTFRPGKRRKFWTGASVFLMTVAGGLFVSSFLARDPGSAPISNLVVVPPFGNRTGDPELDEVAALAAEWVEESIQQVDGVLTVPSTFARRYAAETARDGSPVAVQTVAERSKAAWAVGGVVSGSGDSLQFRVEIIDITRGRKAQDVVQGGGRDSLDSVIDGLARRVSGALAYEFDPLMEEQERGSQPLPSVPTLEAFREHRLGYEAYNRRDFPGSFDHHMAAFALDTTLVRALVAAAFMANDYFLRDSLARYASRRRQLLSRKGQLDLDVLLAFLGHDREGALRAIREMAQLEEGGFSSVIEGSFAMAVNRPRAALEAMDRYDPNLEWRRGEAHAYWRYRTHALHMLGEFEEELHEARRGRERYPAQLDLLSSEVRASAALGRLKEVSDLLHHARALSDTHYAAALVAGAELREHGFLDEARDAFDRAAEWLTSGLPPEGLDSTARLHLAEALYGAERWAEAQEISISLLEESPEDLSALGILGLTGARLGDSVLASEIIDRLSGMSRPADPGEHLYLMASISAILEKPEEAMRLLYQAFAEGFPHGLRLHQDLNFELLREREDFRALVSPKG